MIIRRTALQLGSHVFPEGLQDFLLAKATQRLKKELCEELTDEFLETLLRGMDLSFLLSPSYRANIRGFHGTCVFRTSDNKVTATAVFQDGHMEVTGRARDDYNVRVTFKDAHALWSFLLSENQDILDSILANTVDVEGNLNYLYRFGFLAKDLTCRLGIT